MGNGTISYYYKKDGEDDSKYEPYKENTTELTANIEGLEQNVVYNIRIVAENENGSTEKIVNEMTGELKAGTISPKGPTVWNSGTASIELETTETGVTIQYQIDTMEGQWLDYEGPITGLNHNQNVFAVITDGNNISGYTTIKILDEKAPTVTVNKGTITTNSIQVNVNSSDAEWGMPESITYNYYIKTSAGSYKTDPDHTGTETSYTFTGLTQNTSYDVKVTTSDKAGNPGEGEARNITTNTVGGASEDLREGNIVASEPTWQNGTASITLSKGTGVASNLTIQYQVGATTGNWTTAQEGANSVTVTGLQHSNKVYARLTDGTNTGSYASVDILDGITPQLAQINLSGTSTNTTGSITATVTHTDNESGIDIANCRWVYNTNASKIGTEISSYPSENTFSSNGKTITLSASSPATYYLHVLTVDKAGNKVETISQPITVTQLVTGITLNKTNITLTEGETLQLTATITPNNANNKTVSWSSNNNTVASVSSTGLITAKAEGTAIITVKANDGSGITKTCNITVNRALPTIEETLEEGNYVYYDTGTEKGTIKCVVLYGPENANYSTYGIQIIAMETLENIELGNGTGNVSSLTIPTLFNTSMDSYNNSISTLNDATNKYLNIDYADKVRCVGSNPSNPRLDNSGYFTSSYSYMSNYNGKFKNADTNYETDLNQMENLEITGLNWGTIYWLASRRLVEYTSNVNIGVYSIMTGSDSNGQISVSFAAPSLCHVFSNGTVDSCSVSYGLRPVFTLQPELKITGGSGTPDSPYTFGT